MQPTSYVTLPEISGLAPRPESLQLRIYAKSDHCLYVQDALGSESKLGGVGGGSLSGTLLFTPDATYDIGANGANRPRDIYVAHSIQIGSATGGGAYTISRPTDGAQMTALVASDQSTLRVGGGNQGQIDLYAHQTPTARFDRGFDGLSGRMILPDVGQLAWGSSGFSAPDVYLWREAANTLAQRNGTNKQTHTIYSTYIDASNYARLRFTNNGSFIQQIFAEGLGTPGNQDLSILAADILFATLPSATVRWQVNNAGHFLAGADNTYNIGATGASRPGNIYAGSTIEAPYLQADNQLIVYSSFTDASNWVRLAITSNAGNVWLAAQYAGTGNATPNLYIGPQGNNGNIYFRINNADSWRMTPTGLIAATDNAIDIGASGANRPRNVYLANTLFSGAVNPGSLSLNAAGGRLFSGANAPNASLGADGDYFFRSDTPGTANQRVYVHSAGAWVGIV